jgi:hypothetical protein
MFCAFFCDATGHSEPFNVHAMPLAPPQEESVRGMTLVSGGCDNAVRIWAATATAWEKDTVLAGHTGTCCAVRAVAQAGAPSICFRRV